MDSLLGPVFRSRLAMQRLRCSPRRDLLSSTWVWKGDRRCALSQTADVHAHGISISLPPGSTWARTRRLFSFERSHRGLSLLRAPSQPAFSATASLSACPRTADGHVHGLRRYHNSCSHHTRAPLLSRRGALNGMWNEHR